MLCHDHVLLVDSQAGLSWPIYAIQRRFMGRREQAFEHRDPENLLQVSSDTQIILIQYDTTALAPVLDGLHFVELELNGGLLMT